MLKNHPNDLRAKVTYWQGWFWSNINPQKLVRTVRLFTTILPKDVPFAVGLFRLWEPRRCLTAAGLWALVIGQWEGHLLYMKWTPGLHPQHPTRSPEPHQEPALSTAWCGLSPNKYNTNKKRKRTKNSLVLSVMHLCWDVLNGSCGPHWRVAPSPARGSSTASSLPHSPRQWLTGPERRSSADSPVRNRGLLRAKSKSFGGTGSADTLGNREKFWQKQSQSGPLKNLWSCPQAPVVLGSTIKSQMGSRFCGVMMKRDMATSRNNIFR